MNDKVTKLQLLATTGDAVQLAQLEKKLVLFRYIAVSSE
jgi:hypothetical protein